MNRALQLDETSRRPTDPTTRRARRLTRPLEGRRAAGRVGGRAQRVRHLLQGLGFGLVLGPRAAVRLQPRDYLTRLCDR